MDFVKVMKVSGEPFSRLAIHLDLNLRGLDVWLSYNDKHKSHLRRDVDLSAAIADAASKCDGKATV